jgi:hypothetical protein
LKNLKVIGTITILLLLSGLLLSSALAQTRVAGVSVGNTFKYTYALDANVSSTEFALPTLFEALMEQARAIDWVQITVSKVSGTSVTTQMTMQFKNGTQQSNTGITDLATGQGNLTMFLIAANLNPNDKIYTGNTNEKINETITKTYPSGSRQVNHEAITMEYNVTEEELSDFNMTALQQSNTQDIYWDRQLGSLVEMSYSMVTRSEKVNADISVSIALIESNVYTVPEYPALMLVLIILIVYAIAASKLRQ